MKEISWYYSKDAYLQTYSYKLQPVRGRNFWKVEYSDAMEPPPIAKMSGRPKVKRVRAKNEEIKRMDTWRVTRMSSKGRCSICGDIDHNIRSCTKIAEDRPTTENTNIHPQPQTQESHNVMSDYNVRQ
ncbi:hypothetical protein Cni_G12858 [Canna indica]|uniref:Uncharacterized protein n=1 Tax=Canna indica TaxID=4628 RepID=A0AAQ3K980_9LILI|nr:hypothetical protein Cni_G12858 [Canna indica]